MTDTTFHQRANHGHPLVVHVTTVPMSLIFIRGLARSLQRQGMRVEAVSSPGKGLSEFGAELKLATHGVTMHRSIAPLSDLRAVWQLARLFSRSKPDIVHAHTPKGGLLGMLAAALARVPVRVYHMRGLPLMGARGPRRAILWLSEWVSCRLAHRVLCVSHSLRAVAIEARLCAPARVRVLAGGSGQGVDASGRFNPEAVPASAGLAVRQAYGIPPDAEVIGFVGRIVRDKGVVELESAWSQLRAEFTHVHLLLVGPVESQDAVPAELLERLAKDSRVHYAGLQEDTPRFYAAMDVVVLPTYREGFPNVPLEAAAMRIPVVATRIPGCVDAVADGVTGTLVPPQDAGALTEGLRSYLVDPDLRRRHGFAGRERVIRDFAQEAIWEAVRDEYRALLLQKA